MTEIQPVSEDERTLVAILTCSLCRNKVNNPHICPNCSKFCCFECIASWLNTSSNCNFCQKDLNKDMLVNCNKLCGELNATLEAMQAKRDQFKAKEYERICNQHDLIMHYYCKTCDVSLCSDCSMLTSMHRGHEFLKLAEVQANFDKKIHLMRKVLESVKQQIQLFILEQESIREKEKKISKVQIDKFEECVRYMNEKLIKNISSSLKEKQCIYDFQKKKLLSCQQFLVQVDKFIKNCPPMEMVYIYTTIKDSITQQIQECYGQRLVSKQTVDQLAEKCSLSSVLCPSFQVIKFKVEKFSEKRKQLQYFFTQSVDANGLDWRLKIYPNGIRRQRNQISDNNLLKIEPKQYVANDYISIFVELAGGIISKTGKTRQKYKIELINQVQSEKIISKQFESDFQIGECWGYEQYAKIKTILQEGYIHSQMDCIEISLSIAPSDFHQKFSYQQVRIDRKIRQKQQNSIKISQLQASLHQYSLQRKQQ